MMGAALGGLDALVLPAVSPGFWPLISMGAILGGTMRAPLTALMFGLELTHDINALLPLAIGCATAHATTVLLMRRSILTEKIARHGHHIVREYVVDPFESMRVSDIMARPAQSVPASWTVRDVVTFFTASEAPRRHKSYPVTDAQGRVAGMVSRADALRWMLGEVAPERSLAEQLTGQELMTGYEDELVGHLADRMSATDTGRVPILARENGALVGLVARRDLLRVRASARRHEHEREALIRWLPRRL
jgi:CBS domain-containing protein